MRDRERKKQARKRKRGMSGLGCAVILLGAACVAAFILLFLSVMNRFPERQGGLSGILFSGEKAGKGIVICIDPGHGYGDPGAVHSNLNGLEEKDINLDIALRVADLLKQKGYSVLMTRISDEVPENLKPDENGRYVLDPYARCEMANSAGIDLFLSIHCNALPGHSDVKGMQLYYTEHHTADNQDYAEILADSVEEETGQRPQIIANPENDSFVVNRLVKAPSVLVETGFITNEEDAARLLSSEWRQRIAGALAKGIGAFLEKS